MRDPRNHRLPNLLLLLVAAAVPAALAAAEIPAFPGAEGWGSTTPGGRGGEVFVVDTLDDVVADDGLTSLREAVLAEGPRTVVFRVSGVIELTAPLDVGAGPEGTRYSAFGDNPHGYLTLAGQSAPGGGVTLTGYPLEIGNYVSDVVVRFLRVRGVPRDRWGEYGPRSLGDGIDLQSARRVVIDHCSVAWVTDEAISLEKRDNLEITVQRSILAETLLQGGHEQGDHSRGMNVSYGADQVSIHRNFFAHNNRRSPHLMGNRRSEEPFSPLFDVRANVIYNHVLRGIHFGHSARANVTHNLFRAGPGTDPRERPLFMEDDDEGTTVYLEGNRFHDIDGDLLFAGGQEELVGFKMGHPTGLADEPFDTPPLEPIDLATLEGELLPHLGALPHDAVDLRLLEEYATGTGTMGGPPECQWHACAAPEPEPGKARLDSDRDGIPNFWEHPLGLDARDPADAQADPDGDGYTHLEDYLHWLAWSHDPTLPEPRVGPVEGPVPPGGEDRFTPRPVLEMGD